MLRSILIIGGMAVLMVVLEMIELIQGSAQLNMIFWLDLAAKVVIIATIVLSAPVSLREMAIRREEAANAVASREVMERLFQMTDMLQSAMDHSDANAVLRSTAEHLLEGFGGALYIFNNSRDRLDLSTRWNWVEGEPPPETISPSQCWALKRGKEHLNQTGIGALRCEHHGSSVTVLEIPMMARGEVYGLLVVQAGGEDAEHRLSKVSRLTTAIADGMSLALSNIALREKLRTQALRDPLTGLYNRRYMEDMLERYAGLAERSDGAVSVLMIDLDHFKLLNDEHGHAMGDAILRETASTIIGALRQCDVACRYGGEELVVLLPDCHLPEAMAKAEMIRARIESLSDLHGVRVTASFGVATIPDTAKQARDVLPLADAALYRAKQQGRNRVVASQHRGEGAAAELRVAAE